MMKRGSRLALRVVAVAQLALVALLPGLARAEGPSFKLLDARQVPLAGAGVSVIGRTGSVRTAPDGTFRLDPVPRVPFELAVADERGTWLGIVRVTTLGAATPVVLTLPAQREAEVLVRGGLAPATVAPPASAATVVSRQEMAERRPAHVADVLADIPGTGRIEDGQSVVPSLRGLARSRTLLLVDDARVTAERRAGPSATYVDPFVMENLEVVRGPGSVAYGSDALGGTIHARTPLPSPDGFAARYEVAAGTPGDPVATGAVELNVPAGPVSFLVQAHQRAIADFESPSGRIDNSAARDRGFLVRALVPLGGVRLFAGVQVDQGRDIGKPSIDSYVTRAFYPKEDSNRFTFGADLGSVAGFSEVEVRGYLGLYRLVTDRDRYATATVTRLLSRADVKANDASLRASASRPLGAGALRLGVDVNGRIGLQALNTTVNYDAQGNVTSNVEEVAIDSADRTDWGAFVETDQPLVRGVLDLGAGLRGDYVKTRNEGGYYGDRSRNDSALSGYVALTGRPAPGLSVTFQAARGFRDPMLSDRYFRGISGRGFVTGNPDLTPETSLQLDLGVRYTGGPVRLAAYGFLYRIKDLVERYKVGNDFFFRNRGEEELKGLELEADVTLARGLTGRVTATTIQGRILDDGSNAGDVPPDSLGFSIDHKVTDRLWWRASWTIYARKSDPGPTESVVPGYALVDASAGYRLADPVDLRLVLRNLFNKEYQGTTDALSPSAPGRSATLVLAGRF